MGSFSEAAPVVKSHGARTDRAMECEEFFATRIGCETALSTPEASQ